MFLYKLSYITRKGVFGSHVDSSEPDHPTNLYNHSVLAVGWKFFPFREEPFFRRDFYSSLHRDLCTCSLFTINIQTPCLLTTPVNTSKTCLMNCKQCRPWSILYKTVSKSAYSQQRPWSQWSNTHVKLNFYTALSDIMLETFMCILCQQKSVPRLRRVMPGSDP